MARYRQVQAVSFYSSQVKAHCRVTTTLAKDCPTLENKGKEGSLTNGQYEAVIFKLTFYTFYTNFLHFSHLLFKLRLGASISHFKGLSVGQSVVPWKFLLHTFPIKLGS